MKPAVEEFLRERGLNLSEQKTAITHIKDSFMFLGQTFRKHGKTLHIKPSKEGVESLTQRLGGIIRKYVSAPMPLMIKKLNSVLRGWGNYHRHVVAGRSFYRIDDYVYNQLWRMLKKRHPAKPKKWLIKKYWMASGVKWVFSAVGKTKLGKKVYSVVRLCKLGIKRHIKIKADANPYLKEYAGYFWQRRHNKEKRFLPAFTARANRAILYSN